MFSIDLHDRPISDYRSAYPADAETAKGKAQHRALIEARFILPPKLSAFLSTVTTADDLDRFGAALEAGLRGLG